MLCSNSEIKGSSKRDGGRAGGVGRERRTEMRETLEGAAKVRRLIPAGSRKPARKGVALSEECRRVEFEFSQIVV